MKFNSNATEMNLDNALFCAKLSQIVYKDEKDIQNFIASENLKHKFFNKAGNQCLLAWNDENIFIAFAGTDLKQTQDIIDDLDADCIRSIDCGCVHEGFYTRAIQVNIWIMEMYFQFINTDNKDRRIWITGHSLGGAIAIVFANMLGVLSTIGNKIAGIYTFGQPRVGNRKFVKCFNKNFGKKTFRFVHTCDIITRFPSVFSGYRNNDTMVYIDYYDKIKNYGFFLRTFDRLRNLFLHFGKIHIPEVEEHFIQNYITVIIKLMYPD